MLQKRTTLRLGSLWFDEPSASVQTFLLEELAAEESLVGLLQTGPVAGQDSIGWLIVTCRRTFLLWEQVGEVLHFQELERADSWRVKTGWGRDSFIVGDREVFTGPLVGGKKLRQLFELGAKTSLERLVAAAEAHHLAGKGAWTEAGSTEAMAVSESFFEAATEAEGAEDYERAAELYVGAIRWQRERLDAYERLVELAPQVGEARREQVRMAKSVLDLVDAEAAEEIFGRKLQFVLPEARGLAGDCDPLSEEAHDEHLIHPDEHRRSVALHRLSARWACGQRDDEALRTHCERAGRKRYPELCEQVERIARFLDIPAPPVHLSRQQAGACAMGRGKKPFILLAKAHLEEDNPRKLSAKQLSFALASQAEHIRAGHLLFTRAEYLTGIKERGVDLALMAGEWLGARGLMGAKKAKVFKVAKPVWGARNAAGSEWLALTSDAARAQSTALARWGKSHALHHGHDEDDGSLSRRDLAQFSRVARYTADRAGLLACGDLRAAVEAMHQLASQSGATPDSEIDARIDELIRFALSEEYLELHLAGATALPT